MSSIHLSEKHGVNPAIPHCYFCNKEKNEIILAGQLKDDVEAPRGKVWNMEPCDECSSLMEQGIILISVADGEENKPNNDNPYRTGNFCVIKDEAIKRIINDSELCDHILSIRYAFIPDEVWVLLDLPR